MGSVRLITVLPGHFHAALIQKEMLPGVDRQAHVYGRLDDDLLAHLARVAAFNARPDRPTAWALEVHAGPDWRERFLRERPGNVVVLAGRNRVKIELLRAAAEAGLHVLADKPWIIEADQFPELEAALAAADRTGAVVHDLMTERFEITSVLQRELVNDPDVFGSIVPGTVGEPGVFMASVHHLRKEVAGALLRRPAWFFDVAEQGEGLADVGTHLVDLVNWMLFPHASIDYRLNVQLLAAQRWPTRLSRREFEELTGLQDFPKLLRPTAAGDAIDYFCNTRVDYALRGIHIRLDVRWDYEAPPGGGDTHNAVFRGTKSRVEVRQPVSGLPELYVLPAPGVDNGPALARRVDAWQAAYPDIGLGRSGGDYHVSIPAALRTGHETHFAEVLAEFLRFVADPGARSAWERANLLAKYRVTTGGVALARASRSAMGG